MKRIVLLLLRLYQLLISPLTPAVCGFYPSCSQYAFEAVQSHGPVWGLLLAAWRLLRCNPWNRGGIDLVPRHSKGASV